MSLTTLSALKTALGISGTGEDAALTQILAALDVAVPNWCNRLNLEQVTVTEYYDGTGRQAVALKRRPVTAVSAVLLDTAGYYGQAAESFSDATLLTAGLDYAVRNLEENESNPALLVRLNGCWPRNPGCLKVSYTAGYSSIPADLVQAVHLLAALWRGTGEKGMPLASETLGQYAYDLLSGSSIAGTSAELVQAQSLLGRYREILI